MQWEKNPFSQERLYWILQIGGWSLYTLLNYLSAPLFDFTSQSKFFGVNAIISAVVGIFTSHVYRLLIKRWKWVYLPYKQLIPRVLTSSLMLIIAGFIINLVLTLVVMICYSMIRPDLFINSPTINLDSNYWGYFYLSLLNDYAIYLIWSLLYFVFHYVRNFQQSQIRELTFSNKLNEAELNALKAQINPHFLFNALNSIRAVADDRPDLVKNLVNQLSNLLRSSLNMGAKQWILFKDEIETIDNYLAIESVRFEERLSVSKEIDPKALEVPFPPMLLQTLVENAIKHGVARKITGGHIDIKASVHQDWLDIEIFNPGVYSPQQSSGYGLNNARQRLQILYGNKSHFEITQVSPDTVKVFLHLPIQPPKNHEQVA